MAYQIMYTRAARLDLAWLAHRSRRYAATVTDAIPEYLAGEPARPSLKRRAMEPNPLAATWHLRLGLLRVYYDIQEDEQTVWILRVGIKERNRLTVRGAVLDLRNLGEQEEGQ